MASTRPASLFRLAFSLPLLVVISACGTVSTTSAAGAAPSHTLTGHVTINRGASGMEIIQGACYPDMILSNVTIKDGSGNVIATGTLNTAEDVYPNEAGNCVHSFSVKNVSEVAIYQIAVGHNDPTSVSLNDMQSKNWTVDLSVA